MSLIVSMLVLAAMITVSIATEELKDSSTNESCTLPRWKLPRYTNQGLIVRYNTKCEASLLRCFCLTASTKTNNSTAVQFALGQCLEGCFITDKYSEYRTVAVDDSLNNSLCSQYSRNGTLCGECMSGHGPPPYSFSLRCIKCPETSFWSRLLYYLLIAYGPLSLFMVTIVVFTISSNMAPLHGLIFVCQTITCPTYMRILTRMAEIGHIDQYTYRIIGTAYGIWNLDFFRTVYEPFCLHEDLTTLHVIALDLAVAAYPLVTIVFLYAVVKMHSHGYRVLVVIFSPFHKCCLRFRQQLDIQTTLVDAFGTFFCLSFVKMFCTTMDLMVYTRVWKEDTSDTALHTYYQGNTVFLGSKHLLFAISSMFLLFVFNVLPITLLLLYSFPKTQEICAKCLPLAVHNNLYPFVDNILSCYKDGTNGTSNCRYFAVVYHILRITCFLIVALTKTFESFPLLVIMVSLTVLLIAIIRPYKSSLYNALDAFLLFCLSTTLAGSIAFFIAYEEAPDYGGVSVAIVCISVLLPLLFTIVCVGCKLWALRVKALHIVNPVIRRVKCFGSRPIELSESTYILTE